LYRFEVIASPCLRPDQVSQ